MKEILKKCLIVLSVLLSLCGCQKETPAPSGCDIQDGCDEEVDKADMSEYEKYIEGEDYVFVKSSVKEMAEMMDERKSFCIYFGFAKCPWCRDIMPILNEAAKRSGVDTVYYVDTRENPEWKSNLDIDDYDLLVERIGQLLEEDENGIPHLYTPLVLFVKYYKDSSKSGISTIKPDDYDAHTESISEEEAELLLRGYMHEFERLAE